jgi:hypothetical protein
MFHAILGDPFTYVWLVLSNWASSREQHVAQLQKFYGEVGAIIDEPLSKAYLGHKSIQHTVRYTELAPTRFKSLFRD